MRKQWEFVNAGTMTAGIMLIAGPLLVSPAFSLIGISDKNGNVMELWHPLAAVAIVWFLCFVTYLVNFFMMSKFWQLRCVVKAHKLYERIQQL